MDLLEVRAEFVKRSGRYDLVVDTTDWVDNGANLYINSGQRFLDRLDTVPKSWGRRFIEVTSGEYYVTFQFCRAIKEAWVMNTEARSKLDKQDISDLREFYASPVGELTSGTPVYYAPAVLRPIPDSLTAAASEAISGFDDILLTSTHYEYNGVIFYPPADGTYTIEVWGLFYSPSLDDNDDESYWSITHPEVLLMAAMHQLEIAYRNTEGAKDWLAAINLEVGGIGRDFVEEHIAEVSQMEG